MWDGSTKAIEDVQVGDTVKSFHHSSLGTGDDAIANWTATEIENGAYRSATVQAVTNNPLADSYYWLNYNLKVTEKHPMLVFKDNVFKFVNAEDLAVGDEMVLEDGTLQEIFAIPEITQTVDVYNMDVETDDNYIVKGGNGNGYIAYNKEDLV